MATIRLDFAQDGLAVLQRARLPGAGVQLASIPLAAGAAGGANIAALGDTVASLAEAERRTQAETEQNHARASALQAMAEVEADANGDVDRYRTGTREAFTRIAEGIGDPATRARFLRTIEPEAAAVEFRVRRAGTARRGAEAVASLEENLGTTATRAAATDNPVERDALRAGGQDAIAGAIAAGYLTPAAARSRAMRFDAEVSTATALRLIQQNPVEAVRLLNDPEQLPGLNPVQRYRLLDRAMREGERGAGGMRVGGGARRLPAPPASPPSTTQRPRQASDAEFEAELEEAVIPMPGSQATDAELAVTAEAIQQWREWTRANPRAPYAERERAFNRIDTWQRERLGPRTLTPEQRSSLDAQGDREAAALDDAEYQRTVIAERRAADAAQAATREAGLAWFQAAAGEQAEPAAVARFDAAADLQPAAVVEASRAVALTGGAPADDGYALATLTGQVGQADPAILRTSAALAVADGRITPGSFVRLVQSAETAAADPGWARVRRRADEALTPPDLADLVPGLGDLPGLRTEALAELDGWRAQNPRAGAGPAEAATAETVARAREAMVDALRARLPVPEGLPAGRAYAPAALDQAEDAVMAALDAGEVDEGEAARRLRVLDGWRWVAEALNPGEASR